ncbi:MAG: UbiX family flavin prenyltransferase [Chitinophagaceae bacterium]
MQKIVIAITGASGSVYAKVLLDKMQLVKDQWTSLAVVMSDNAKAVWLHEMGDENYKNYPVCFYEKNDFNAPFASGSGQYQTMILIPCSMGTLGRVASGLSDDLVTRAADVILKEHRKLIMVVRETPYNLIHLRNMQQVTEAGGIICPATPSFYSQPKTIEEVAATVVDRVMDLAGLVIHPYRWGAK